MPINPAILFEDQHLIVIDKPPGMLSQGEHTGDPNVVDWLRMRWERPYVGLVHRLDRNTSGIMIVAKRSKAATRLTHALQAGKIYRSYLAWCLGTLETPVRWSHRLLKDERANKTRVVTGLEAGAKEAVLTATPLERASWEGTPLTLVEFVLETGRSHQIRAQAAHEGYALLGDVKYAPAGSPSFPRPALHSHRLRFPHPMDPEGSSLREHLAPLPEDMERLKK